ncbi:hypothetical protein ACISMT_09025 [Campylobacter jejuni]
MFVISVICDNNISHVLLFVKAEVGKLDFSPSRGIVMCIRNREEGDKYKIICYSKEEFEKAFKKIKILHYTYLYMPKPWENVYSFIDDDYNLVYYEFYDAWWDMALKTPIYGEHFAKKKREYEKKSLLTYAQAM